VSWLLATAAFHRGAGTTERSRYSQSIIPKALFPQHYSQRIIPTALFPQHYSQSIIPTALFPQHESMPQAKDVPKVEEVRDH
jgi:hypothetical protein